MKLGMEFSTVVLYRYSKFYTMCCCQMRDVQCVLSLQGKKKKNVKEKSMLMHLDSVLLKPKSRPYSQPVPRILFRPKFVAFHAIIIPRGKNGGTLAIRILCSLPEHFDSFRMQMVLLWIFLLEKL